MPDSWQTTSVVWPRSELGHYAQGPNELQPCPLSGRLCPFRGRLSGQEASPFLDSA
jgi:hypothetical protein